MNTQIKVAIANGDLQKIKKHFKQYSISASIHDQDTPLLFYAIDYPQLHLLEYFLHTERVEKVIDVVGNTVLMRAIEQKNIQAVQLLLKDHKELVSIGNMYKKTPLLLACQLGLLEIMEMLLVAGSSIEEHDEQGYYPLHFACAYGHFQIAKQLILKGADPFKKNQNGWAPIDYSFSNQLLEYVDGCKSLLGCMKAFVEKRPMPVVKEDSRILKQPSLLIL